MNFGNLFVFKNEEWTACCNDDEGNETDCLMLTIEDLLRLLIILASKNSARGAFSVSLHSIHWPIGHFVLVLMEALQMVWFQKHIEEIT